LEALDAPHLVLHGRDADVARRPEPALVVRNEREVHPLHVRRPTRRVLVGRKVIRDEALHDEAVRDLRREHRVEELLLLNALDVILRSELRSVLLIARNAAADDHALQVLLAAEVLARIVEASREAEAPMLR